MPRMLASAQNELTPPATSRTSFPINSSGFSKKYRRYSSKVRPSRTTRSSRSPRFLGGPPPIALARVCLEQLAEMCTRSANSPTSREDRDNAGCAVVSSNADPGITANSPEIKITIGPVTGRIERQGSGYARIRVGLTHECRLESVEVLQATHILQSALENKQHIVSR